MTDHATWISFTNEELATLKDYLDGARRLTEDECAQLLSRLDTYTADDAKDQRFRDAAEELPWVREGECEVDDHAVVSASEDGAYVMAWVWVERESVEPGYVPTYLREDENV